MNHALRLLRLELSRFRNYAQFEFEPKPDWNVIKGPVAVGKSNLLEAIFFLTQFESFRRVSPKNLILWGENSFLIRSLWMKEDVKQSLDIQYSSSGELRIVKNRISRCSKKEIVREFLSVCFSKYDLAIVEEGPEVRRRWLDILLSKINETYYQLLKEYRIVLKQRNAVLKSLKKKGVLSGSEELEIWTERYRKYAELLTEKRNSIIIKLSENIKNVAEKLTEGREKLTMHYLPSLPDSERIGVLSEIEKGFSLWGPHRDDWELKIDGRSVKHFASEGQKKTAILSLRLLEIELLKETFEREPVLLFDDYFNELDDFRRKKLLELLPEQSQKFLATTESSPIDWLKEERLSVWRHDGNQLKKEEEIQ